MIPQRHSKEHLKAEGREMEKDERCNVSCFFLILVSRRGKVCKRFLTRLEAQKSFVLR